MVNQQQQQQQINENLKIEAIRWYQKLQEITYLEAGQHMRALNQLMWQIPSFVIAVNGGLWYATTLANESSLWIIFAVLALFDFTTMITLYRLRSLIGSKIALQKNIEDPSKNYILNEITRDAGFKLPSSYDNKETGYIVVSCWAIMLIAYLPSIYHLIFTLSFRMLKSLFYNLRVSLWMSVQVPAVMLLR